MQNEEYRVINDDLTIFEIDVFLCEKCASLLLFTC